MMDWTYDLYIADVASYTVNDKGSENYTAYFIATIKEFVEKFKTRWLEEHNGKQFDGQWMGDAFAEGMLDWFSDFYKEAYNQRPHLPMWYYIHPLGLPMTEDSFRTFCADPIRDASQMATRVRSSL